MKPVLCEDQAFMGTARWEKMEVNRAPLHSIWPWGVLRIMPIGRPDTIRAGADFLAENGMSGILIGCLVITMTNVTVNRYTPCC